MALKHDLLAELESNRNADLSGQKLAERLGVSRNAVWKAMAALKEDGHEILSGRNRGYRLAETSDLLSAEGIGGFLTGRAAGLPVFAHRELDSTNNEAKRLLARGGTGDFLVVSESQSGGRGRNGRAFYSPARTGLYMSLALYLQADFAEAVSVTAMAAVAVVRAVDRLTDRRPQIKWVNDVYLDGGKICGILTEAVMDFESGTAQSVVVGIGLNVSTRDFPAGLDGAASLFPAGITRNRLAAEITSQLLALTGDLSDKSYLDEYRSRSMVLGKRIAYGAEGAVRTATAVGIDANGGLIVRGDDGETRVLSSGEISIRPL